MAGGSIVGEGAIILSGGAATPVVAGLLSVGASTTILYGASDIYERGDTYRLADAGDLTSIARNPIRDSVFNGNQMVYDTWGTIGSLAFLAGGMMQTAATISSQRTVQVENLTERANAVGKGAGGAKNPNSQLQKIFDLADDYKLSDDVYNNHIMERHGSGGNSFPNKSKFNSDFDIKIGIDDALRSEESIVKPNTAGREGAILSIHLIIQ